MPRPTVAASMRTSPSAPTAPVNYLEQMRQIATLGELSEECIAPDAREALLDAFRDWRG